MGNESAKHTPEQQLNAARSAAFAFGRCCDLYQDGFGTFHCHRCGQATFEMLRQVQEVLGNGSESAMDHEETVAVALKRNAAPDLYDACNAVLDLNFTFAGGAKADAINKCISAIAKATP